jgi:hypothetical protein
MRSEDPSHRLRNGAGVPVCGKAAGLPSPTNRHRNDGARAEDSRCGASRTRSERGQGEQAASWPAGPSLRAPCRGVTSWTKLGWRRGTRGAAAIPAGRRNRALGRSFLADNAERSFLCSHLAVYRVSLSGGILRPCPRLSTAYPQSVHPPDLALDSCLSDAPSSARAPWTPANLHHCRPSNAHRTAI